MKTGWIDILSSLKISFPAFVQFQWHSLDLNICCLRMLTKLKLWTIWCSLIPIGFLFMQCNAISHWSVGRCEPRVGAGQSYGRVHWLQCVRGPRGVVSRRGQADRLRDDRLHSLNVCQPALLLLRLQRCAVWLLELAHDLLGLDKMHRRDCRFKNLLVFHVKACDL